MNSVHLMTQEKYRVEPGPKTESECTKPQPGPTGPACAHRHAQAARPARPRRAPRAPRACLPRAPAGPCRPLTCPARPRAFVPCLPRTSPAAPCAPVRALPRRARAPQRLLPLLLPARLAQRPAHPAQRPSYCHAQPSAQPPTQMGSSPF